MKYEIISSSCLFNSPHLSVGMPMWISLIWKGFMVKFTTQSRFCTCKVKSQDLYAGMCYAQYNCLQPQRMSSATDDISCHSESYAKLNTVTRGINTDSFYVTRYTPNLQKLEIVRVMCGRRFTIGSCAMGPRHARCPFCSKLGPLDKPTLKLFQISLWS